MYKFHHFPENVNDILRKAPKFVFLTKIFRLHILLTLTYILTYLLKYSMEQSPS